MIDLSDLPTPYYSKRGIVLYNADCLSILPLLEQNALDCLVTDPPYGISYQSNLRNERGRAKFNRIAGDAHDDRDGILTALQLCFHILRECRHAYVFGPFDLKGLGFGGVTDLVWNKSCMAGGDLRQPWGPSHERLSFGVRVASKANVRDGYGNGAARIRRGSVLTYARLHGRVISHPNQKPVALLRELIESSSFIGDTVLDPFAGVGSTLVAAKIEGRRAIGIEISEKFCRKAVARLDAARAGRE